MTTTTIKTKNMEKQLEFVRVLVSLLYEGSSIVVFVHQENEFRLCRRVPCRPSDLQGGGYTSLVSASLIIDKTLSSKSSSFSSSVSHKETSATYSAVSSILSSNLLSGLPVNIHHLNLLICVIECLSSFFLSTTKLYYMRYLNN